MDTSLLTYFNGAFAAFYLSASLLFGISLVFDPLHQKSHITASMRLAGFAMLMDSLSIFLGDFIYEFFPNTFLLQASSFCDAILAILFCLTGFALVNGRYPGKKILGIVIIPVLVMLAAMFFIEEIRSFGAAIINIYFGAIMVYQMYLLKQHDNQLRDFYSDTQNRDVRWFGGYIILYIIAQILYYLLYIQSVAGPWGVFIDYTFTILLYNFLAYQLFMHKGNDALQKVIDTYLEKEAEITNGAEPTKAAEAANVVTDVQNTAEATAEHEAAAQEPTVPVAGTILLSADIKAQMQQRLKEVMEEEKLYLHRDLTTGDLARAINSNVTYLYYLMHDEMHTHFYDYVNGYRIKAAKELMLNSDEKMESVALACGYNSYNTFGYVFKKLEGESPAQWRKTHLNVA